MPRRWLVSMDSRQSPRARASVRRPTAGAGPARLSDAWASAGTPGRGRREASRPAVAARSDPTGRALPVRAAGLTRTIGARAGQERSSQAPTPALASHGAILRTWQTATGSVRRQQRWRPARDASALGAGWSAEGRADRRGQRRIPATELARLLAERRSAQAPIAQTSARNHFAGVVISVTKDRAAATVELQAGPHRILSLLTRRPSRNSGSSRGCTPWPRSRRPA